MTAEPVDSRFRRQLRTATLDETYEQLRDRGWDQIRVSQLATAVGVSRPTLYSEFGDKDGIAQALVARETERFLVGIADILEHADDDLRRTIFDAISFTLTEAEASPLLRAMLTAGRAGNDSLLPLLTTRSEPVMLAAGTLLTTWFARQPTGLPTADLPDLADAVVRLVISHILLPVGSTSDMTAKLTTIAMRLLRPQGPNLDS